MPLLNIIWSIFVFFLMVAWIWTVIAVISDVFRSDDLSNLEKGLWVMGIILIPWAGVLAYIILRGEGMRKRNAQAIVEAGEAQRAYIQNIAGTSTADELSKLAELRGTDVITAEEFETQKAKLLG